MKSHDLWRLSLLNAFASPMRSFLTVLGMAIGIGAILAVLTLGDAGKTQVKSEMSRLGVDKVWLTAKDGSTLKHGDAELLSKTLNVTVTEQVYAPAEARFGSSSAAAVVVGCAEDYLRVMDTVVLRGRALYPLEWEADGRSILIGSALSEELRISVGQTLVVAGVPLRAVGVIRQSNELSQTDAERAVFMPIKAFCALMGQTIHELTLSLPDDTKPQVVAAMAVDAMRNLRGVAVEALTMQVQIEAANGVMAIFVDVLKWVAVICILVGGVGVMNIELVGVRERRREIGVMKSLGATRGQIRSLFLLEALLYATAGGLSGVLIGLGLIVIASKSIGLEPIIRLSDCLTVLGAATSVGLFFGAAPASGAARLNPVDALRDD